jgi:hypothetical protein
MSERLDALVARDYTARDGTKKTAWTKIGSAFPGRNGGYLLVLDALPLPGPDGACKVNLMVPRERDGQRPQAQRQSDSQTGGDDDLPF